MRIRHALPGDGSAVAQVRVDSWRAAYAGLMPDELLTSMEVDGSGWERAIASAPERSALLLVEDPEICGFCVLGPDRDGAEATGEIVAFYLHPDVWRQGLGRRLIEVSVEELRRHGFRRAVLWVLSTNLAARRFYEAVGWSGDDVEKTELWNGRPLPHTRYSRAL